MKKMNRSKCLTFIRTHEKILQRQRKWMRAEQTQTGSSSLIDLTLAEQLCCEELTMESFSVVVNLVRISPRFEHQGSKSGPTASSSFSFFFLPRS